MMSMAFGGRYVLLLNGLFAVYVGFLYNEAFSVPLGLFNSTWRLPPHAPPGASAVWDGTVYPFGVDPMWHKASNKMSFFNSFKMKVSIIFGVAQMSLGIVLSLLNHRHFKDARSIKYGFIPEITFFLGIFGYLVVMILRKWSIDWVGEKLRPPSLLNTLIAMFMSPGAYTEEDRLYAGQEYLQLLLVLVAVVAVLVLLIPKPLLFYLDRRPPARRRRRPPARRPSPRWPAGRRRRRRRGDAEGAAEGGAEEGGEEGGEERRASATSSSTRRSTPSSSSSAPSRTPSPACGARSRTRSSRSSSGTR